ncbi:hypothetical protein, partial [Salipaludibacillus sp. CF4.18]|uniref:hypothetical protein n=1 Tax=Salipaludibacillus sp. CF4.18 TaxID=3373081 RepID=UPI003EE7705E
QGELPEEAEVVARGKRPPRADSSIFVRRKQQSLKNRYFINSYLLKKAHPYLDELLLSILTILTLF